MRLIFYTILLLYFLMGFIYSQNIIYLDTNTKYQEIIGWEAHNWIGSPGNPALPYYRDEMLRMAAEDIGINRIRLEIRSGVENSFDYYRQFMDNGYPNPPDSLYYQWRWNRYATINDNDDPNVINWDGFQFSQLDQTIESHILKLREMLANRGEHLYINLNYVAFIKQIDNGNYNGRYHHIAADEYAEFILAAFIHIKEKYGFVPDGLEILLEPEHNPYYNNGTALGKAIVAVSKKLADNGFYPDIIAPSCSYMNSCVSWFKDMLAVEGVAGILDEFAYHRYSQSLSDLQTIVDSAKKYNFRTSMLEWWSDAANYEVLFQDLTTGMNSAWQNATINGLINVDTSQYGHTKPLLNIGKITQFTRLIFKFVRSGARRIEATSNLPEIIQSLAFINKNGTYIVIAKTNQKLKFSIQFLPPGLYGSVYTTDSENFIEGEDFEINELNPLEEFNIPAKGMMVIYNKNFMTPTNTIENNFQISNKSYIYPNPAYNTAYIKFPENLKDKIDIKIFNSIGQLIHFESTNNHSGVYMLEASKFSTGVYSIIMSSGKYSECFRFIINR